MTKLILLVYILIVENKLVIGKLKGVAYMKFLFIRRKVVNWILTIIVAIIICLILIFIFK